MSFLQKHMKMPKNPEVLLSITCTLHEPLVFAGASSGLGPCNLGRKEQKEDSSNNLWVQLVTLNQLGYIYEKFLDGLL